MPSNFLFLFFSFLRRSFELFKGEKKNAICSKICQLIEKCLYYYIFLKLWINLISMILTSFSRHLISSFKPLNFLFFCSGSGCRMCTLKAATEMRIGGWGEGVKVCGVGDIW